MQIKGIQEKLYKYIKDKKGVLTGLSLRDIGEAIGVGKKPQIIAHHLKQLELKGFIRQATGTDKVFEVLKTPVAEVVYINLYESAQCGPEGVLGDDAIVDKIALPSRTFGITKPADFFLIKARGESMEEMIKDGDMVLAHKQDSVANGAIAVVVHDEMPKIKKVVSSKTGNKTKYSLISLNPKYSNEEVFNESSLRVVGLVKGIIRLQKS